MTFNYNNKFGHLGYDWESLTAINGTVEEAERNSTSKGSRRLSQYMKRGVSIAVNRIHETFQPVNDLKCQIYGAQE